MKNIKIWKYSGIFLVATGMLHTIVAIALGKDVFLKIIPRRACRKNCVNGHKKKR